MGLQVYPESPFGLADSEIRIPHCAGLLRRSDQRVGGAAFLLHISALFVCQWPILRLCGRNAAPPIKIECHEMPAKTDKLFRFD